MLQRGVETALAMTYFTRAGYTLQQVLQHIRLLVARLLMLWHISILVDGWRLHET